MLKCLKFKAIYFGQWCSTIGNMSVSSHTRLFKVITLIDQNNNNNNNDDSNNNNDNNQYINTFQKS